MNALKLNVLGAMLVIAFSSPCQAITVQEYFSVQKQASEPNAEQKMAQNSLKGVYAGLRDGLFAALYFGQGVLTYDGRPFVCIDDLNLLTQEAVRNALTDVIGTYETPKLSPSAASAMPIGMHAMVGLSRQFACGR